MVLVISNLERKLFLSITFRTITMNNKEIVNTIEAHFLRIEKKSFLPGFKIN